MKRARYIVVLLLVLFWSFAKGADKTQFSISEAMDHVRQLSVAVGSRPAGTKGELEAVDYIAEQFARFGYMVERQSFEFPYFEDRGTSLVALDAQAESLVAYALVYSSPGDIEGELVYVGLGRDEDFEGSQVAGKIALMERGTLTFQNKVANAAARGAKGAVVYNNAQGIVRGTLQELGAIPAVIIDRPSGEKLRDRLSSGPLRVRLVVKSVSERRTSYNVVARWPGAEGHKVVVGGHYDSVAEGPGANDNASGVAIVLELARLSAHTEVGRQTLFVAFGAEELGLFGSRHFAAGLVGSQIEALSAMMNLDMVGVGDRMIAVGDAKMTELSRWFGLEVGQNVVVNSQPGGSDHAPFARRGVRVLFLTRPDDTNYHTARDTFDNIQPKLLELAGQIAELVLKHLIMVGDEALLYGWSGKGSQVVLSPEDNPKSM